jgi:Fe2+ transport system protein FeoA
MSLNYSEKPPMTENSRCLADLTPGQSATIEHVGGQAEVRFRLLEMGLTNGTSVRLVRRAPLGDPLELDVRGYRLSLRKSEARGVSIGAV